MFINSGRIIICQSDNFLTSVVLGNQVEPQVSSDAEFASGCMIFPSGCNRWRKEWWNKLRNHQAVMNNTIQNQFLHNHLLQRDPPADLEERTFYSLIFHTTPTAIFPSAQNLQAHRAERKNLESRQDRKPHATEFGMRLRRIMRFSMRRERVAIVASLRGGSTRCGHSMDSGVSMQKPRPHKKRRTYCSYCKLQRTSLELSALTNH